MRLFAIISVVAVLSVWSALAGPNEGAQLRSFLHEIIIITGEDPAIQADSLRKVFAKHADLLPHLLDGNEFPKLMQDADLHGALAKVADGNKIRNILEEGVQTQVSVWLRTLEKTAGMPETQMSERVFIARRFLTRLARNPKAEAVLAGTRRKAWEFSKEFAQATEGERYAVLKIIPDVAFTNFADRFNQTVEQANFSKLGMLDMMLDEKQGVRLPDLSSEEAAQLNESFRMYFDRLPVEDKRRIIAAWMKLPPGTPMESQLAEVLQNSGPGLQKMFQLFGRDSPNPQVRAIMKELLSNVKPFDTNIAKKIIEQTYGKPIAELFLAFEEKPIAAGTIGQVYRAQLKDGSWVAVKVQRPGIQQQMDREFATLLKLAEGNKAAQELIKRLKANFTEELDFQIEEKNYRILQAYADKKLGLNVPKPINSMAATRTIIVTELAPGKALAQMEQIRPQVRGQAVYNALKRWFDEVMFGSGFFHGDMHPGNMLIDERAEQKPPFLLSIIDPGSAATLSLEKRRALVRLYFAAASRNADHVLEALDTFNALPPDRTLFRSEVEKILKQSSGVENAIQNIVKTSLSMEAQIDHSLVMFQRANSFLTKELDKVNAELLAANPKAKLFKADNAYLSVGLRRAGWQIPKQFFSKNARNEAAVETSTLRKFFVDKLKGSYEHVKLGYSELFHLFQR